MVLGVLLGLVPIPLPGVGTVTLGIGGGPLIVALIVGRLRRTGPISWVMPLPANIVLRNFGLTLFLATVGINSGQAFVTTVAQTGPLMLLIGAAVLLTTVAIVLLVGFYVLRIPFDDLLGVASGATGNPGHPGLCHAHGADRAAGHRLRHDLPLGDHREGRRRADHRADLPSVADDCGRAAADARWRDRGPAAARDRRQGGGGWRGQGWAGRHHPAHARRARRRLHRLRRDLLQRCPDRCRGRAAFRPRPGIAGHGLRRRPRAGAGRRRADLHRRRADGDGLGERPARWPSGPAGLGTGLGRQPCRRRLARRCWCSWRGITCSAAARSA